MTQQAVASAEIIRGKIGDMTPKLGLVLGSGLGAIAEQIENPIIFSYEDLPGFPVSAVAGHAGKLIVGHLQSVPVVCLQGRAHGYEAVSNDAVKTLIRTIKLLGCETVFLTNAAGSLHTEVGPGELLLITDHINFQGSNPLVGLNDEDFGPRFVAMEDAYCPELRKLLRSTAEEQDINLAQGVYISTLGPMFETPAEIHAFRNMGADAVGMSTVPEVIIARHCGLKVAAVSAITNLAAGMSDEKLSHEGTLHYAGIAANNMQKLIFNFLDKL